MTRKTAEKFASQTSHEFTDHDEIRHWSEARHAVPCCVKGTGKGDDTGIIFLNLPGYSGEESLQEISWNDWFENFDDSGLALLVQETTASGIKSNFNKLVRRKWPKFFPGRMRRGRPRASGSARSCGGASVFLRGAQAR